MDTTDCVISYANALGNKGVGECLTQSGMENISCQKSLNGKVIFGHTHKHSGRTDTFTRTTKMDRYSMVWLAVNALLSLITASAYWCYRRSRHRKSLTSLKFDSVTMGSGPLPAMKLEATAIRIIARSPLENNLNV